jgi:hypothetical protein
MPVLHRRGPERAKEPRPRKRSSEDLPDGEVLGAGLEFVILAADGRIATDYQFVE